MVKIKLGDLCVPSAGQIKEDAEELIDYFDISSVDNETKKVTGFQTMSFGESPSRARKAVKKGSILVSTVRPNLNAVALLEEDTPNISVASTGFCILDCKENVDNRFVFSFCKSKPFIDAMVSQATGASYPAVSDKIVRAALVPKYTYEEQCNISETLDKVSNVIDSRKAELSALDDLIKARFVELFGDVVLNDKHWETQEFSKVTDSRLGKMLDAKRQTGQSSFPYLANANVQWFRFEVDCLNEMDFNEAEQKEFALEEGDLLVCEGGEIGRCAIWHNQVQPCFFQKALHRVRCKQGTILPDYLAWWFKFNCENNGFTAIEGAKATIAHLPGAKLKKLRVVIPPLSLQNQFADFVTQVDKSKVVA